MGGSFSGVVNTEILGSKEEPIVELASVEATESSNGWYSSVTVTARASNSNNTVSAINSCITTEEECTPQSSRSVGVIEKSVTLNESNKLPQKVCFQAVDKNRVTGNIMCSNSYLIDNTSTTTSIALNESSVLGDNNWYQSLTLDITGNNEISGINSLKYCITSTDECVPDQEVNGTSTSVTLESSAAGQKVCAVSLDNKGTTSEVACSNLYNVDTVNPIVSINDDYTVTENSITVSVTASDEDSKVTSYNYTLNGSAYSSCTSDTCTFIGLTGGTGYTVGVSVSDVSGRVSTVVSKVITTRRQYQARETLIANKTITAMPSITGISSDTSNTLYRVADDDGTSYVFRGNPNNNWVKFGKHSNDIPDVYVGYYSSDNTEYFKLYNSLSECQNSSSYNYNCTLDSRANNDMYWRIIRINGDGTVRLIYNGASAQTTGTGTQINGTVYTYSTNGSYNDNAYVGFMYGVASANTYAATHANTNSSNVKTQLDAWYTNSGLSNYAQYIDTNAGFCNDRKVGTTTMDGYGTLGYGINATVYAPFNRFQTQERRWNATHRPILECNQNNTDLFTPITSTKGNKKLSNPIGLITADEVVLAGGFGETTNSSWYLYTNQSYWTMSPYHFNVSFGYMFSVNSHGGFSYASVNHSIGIRPVINLRSDITLTGSGTSSDPYKIEGAA